jgi:serine phosphatase RsbU (regulator of sigma subunit)
MRSEPGRVLALAVLVFFLALRAVDPPFVETTRLRGFDGMQQMAPRGYAPSAVRIVAIDEASLAAQGQWPWPRALVARLIERIAVAEPKAVALDVLFTEPDRLSPQRLAELRTDLPDNIASALRRLPDGDATLAAALRRVPAVLGMGASFDTEAAARAAHGPLRVSPIVWAGQEAPQHMPSYPTLLASRPELRAAERGRGVLVGESDRDGVLRRVPLFDFAEGKVMPSLASETVRIALGGTHRLRASRGGIDAAVAGGREAPVDRHGRAYLHFAPAYEARYVSATALLDGTADPESLRGAILKVRVTGLGLVDVRQTPLGLMDGIEVQAQLVESLLAGTLLRRPADIDGVEFLLAALAGVVAILLPHRRAATAGTIFAAIVIALVAVELGAFRFRGLLVDGVYPALAASCVFAVMVSANLRATERERRRLEGELATARAIQMGLLTRRFPGPPERRDVESHALIEPARSVGGDLYDLVLLDDRRLFFMIADVSGKGVPAALFMAMCKEVLRGAAYRYGVALDLALAEANAKIAAASDDMMAEGAGAMFVTVLAAVVDLQSGAIVHASAGHGAPYLLRAGRPPRALDAAGGPPLGAVDGFPYTVESDRLVPGDLLIAYTDGVTEAANESGALYGTARLERALAAIPPTSAKGVVDALREDVRRFVSGAEPADDIGLVAVRWLSVP